MGDILIKGMEMPKYGCDNCFLRTGNYCGRIEKDESVVEYARKNERHPDCPLIPVQPHGRLIDADALDDLLMNLADNEHTPKVFASWMSNEENAPTIIPASEEG